MDQAEKDRLYQQLEGVITTVSNSTNLLAALARDRYHAVLDASLVLQKRLNDPAEDPFDVKRDILLVTARMRTLNTLFFTLPAAVATLLVASAIIALMARFEGFGLKHLFGSFDNSAYVEMMVLGLAGVILFFFTDTLTKGNQAGSPAALWQYAARLVLALVIPVVVMLLFTTGDGKFSVPTDNDAGLLAFACGYSATLVVELMNKLVEKASRIIQAI